MCVRERERESVCVCERERESVCVCVCVVLILFSPFSHPPCVLHLFEPVLVLFSLLFTVNCLTLAFTSL